MFVALLARTVPNYTITTHGSTCAVVQATPSLNAGTHISNCHVVYLNDTTFQLAGTMPAGQLRSAYTAASDGVDTSAFRITELH
jgi:hypothetical protein